MNTICWNTLRIYNFRNKWNYFTFTSRFHSWSKNKFSLLISHQIKQKTYAVLTVSPNRQYLDKWNSKTISIDLFFTEAFLNQQHRHILVLNRSFIITRIFQMILPECKPTRIRTFSLFEYGIKQLFVAWRINSNAMLAIW